MRRPRPAPLYGVPSTALLALLQSVQWWQSVRAGSPSTSVLWLTALLWGATIGSLLHAFWPRPLPGDERGRWAWGGGGTVRALYAVPTLLLCLYPLALTLRPPAASVQTAQQRSQKALQNLADEVGELHAGSCGALPGWPGHEQAGAARGLSSLSDGPVLVQKLQAAVNRSAAQVVGAKDRSATALPTTRQGNLVVGKVHLLAYGELGDRRRSPVTLEYRGLVYTGRTGPLSAAERAFSQSRFKSYVILRPGHV